MSDFNDGVDDYQSENHMNGVAGNNNSSSGASGNAGYSQNSQSYGQQYGQSAQHHDQQMRQQSQFASPYGQQVQQQMNPQQMSQPQFGQQQFAQPYPYRQPYGQPVQPQMSQQPPYGQPPIGRPYGRTPYGGAPFATRSGYANGRFNTSYIEEQARKFSFRWNAKEIISAIIVAAVAAIFAYLFVRYCFSFSYLISQKLRSIFRSRYGSYDVEGFLRYSICMFPFAIILSFAQVLRKRFFTVASGVLVFIIIIISIISCCFSYYHNHHFTSEELRYLIKNSLLNYFPVVVFFVFVEILQLVITKYKFENEKYILVNFISVIIFFIAHIASRMFISNFDLRISLQLLDIVEFFVVSISMLVILPYLVSLLLKAVKFTKFLNPEREMMRL
ncbi:hypothetical protein [Gardnerella vaginalis]|uniref:hypothetical protein n=1 Tax=Gardnerella vaginalis TaxID=2702 RepID=UPI0039F0DEB8